MKNIVDQSSYKRAKNETKTRKFGFFVPAPVMKLIRFKLS